MRGTVVNKITREPLTRALVYSADNRYAMMTDSEDHFEFTLPENKPSNNSGTLSSFRSGLGVDGLYVLLARKPGFLDDPVGSQVPVSPTNEVTIALLPEAIISGRVLISNGESPGRITVQLFARQIQDGAPHWVAASQVRAKPSGEFRFAELQAGLYKVMSIDSRDNDPEANVPGGLAYGFPPSCFPGVPDFASGNTIQLSAGQTFEADIPVAHQPYFDVRVPVLNAGSDQNVSVTVAAQGHPGPGYTLGYDPSEQRIEGMLPKGIYRLEANSSAPVPASGAVTIAIAGAPIDGPRIALVPDGPIPVNVKEEFTSTEWQGSATWNNGKHTYRLHGPRVYLQVLLDPMDDVVTRGGASLRPPTSPNDESLAIENVQPGLYRLRLSTSRGYVASATSGSLDLLREPLVVGAGSHPPIEVTMRDDAATIEGSVRGLKTGTAATDAETASAAPAAFTSTVQIYCIPLPDSTGQFQLLWASADGHFNSSAMAPGSYRVLAFDYPQPNLPYRDSEAMRAYEAQGQVVHLSPGQTAHVQLQLISSGD